MAQQIIFKPELHSFATAREFAEAFALGEGDLILTNEFIYEPFFAPLGLRAEVLFQEKYGAGEPTDVMTDAILDEIERRGCRRIVAIGGGTGVDIAKVAAVSNGQGVDALYDAMPALEKRRALVIVPTTCGTGSEVTNIAVLARTKLGTKLGMVSPAMFADQAVLIPELLTTLPFRFFATSSIDALVHAVESALSPNATDFTRLLSERAIELILRGYRVIAAEGEAARMPLLADFLLAANFAGLAFGTAGCGAVHALSYPLSGKYHVAHGESNYAMFTGVLRTYAALAPDSEALARVNAQLAALLDCPAGEANTALDALLGAIMPKKPLRDYGVTEADCADFARSVITEQQRLMRNALVPLDEAAVERIYRALL